VHSTLHMYIVLYIVTVHCKLYIEHCTLYIIRFSSHYQTPVKSYIPSLLRENPFQPATGLYTLFVLYVRICQNLTVRLRMLGYTYKYETCLSAGMIDTILYIYLYPTKYQENSWILEYWASARVTVCV
jgi:hypothetical protein